MTRYIAIFETVNGDKFVIEYRPCYDEIAGGIEVLSVDYIPCPRSPWEIRQQERRGHGQRKRGIVLSAEEEHAEAMMPTARREQVQLSMFEV